MSGEIQLNIKTEGECFNYTSSLPTPEDDTTPTAAPRTASHPLPHPITPDLRPYLMNRRQVFPHNPHIPCAHSNNWPVFSINDFPSLTDKKLPPVEYSLSVYKFNTNDLVECIVNAYSATANRINENTRNKREFIRAVIDVFNDNCHLSIQRIFPSLKRWRGGILIWSIENGILTNPSIDEILLITQNFPDLLKNPYCLALYHRNHKVVTVNDIRERLTAFGIGTLRTWVAEQITSL